MCLNCKDIIKKYLKDNGYDGLYNELECGCGLDDFAPCGDGPYPYCQPADLKGTGYYHPRKK